MTNQNQNHNNISWNNYHQTYYNTQSSMPPPPPPPPAPAYPINTASTYYQSQSSAINSSNNSNLPPPPPPAYPVNGYGLPLQQYQQPLHQQQQQQQQQQYSYYGVHGVSYPPPPPPPPPTLQSKQTKHQKGNNANILNNNTPKATATATATAKSTQPLETLKTFHCVPCSQTFQNNTAYQKHLSSHVRCKHYPKCTYTATPKKLKIHYQNSHGGKYAGRGLKQVIVQLPGSNAVQKFKICVGSHPDDVKKWIELRKKKFPTREKILMKKKKLEEQAKKRKLGDVVDDEGNDNDGAITDNNAEGNKKLKCSLTTNTKKNEEEDEQQEQATQDPFGNLACYGSSSDDDDDDDNDDINDETDNKNKNSNNQAENSTNRISTSIVPEGEKSNDDIKSTLTVENAGKGTTTASTTTTTTTTTTNSNFKTKQCRYFLKNGTCKNGDKCTYIHDIAAHKEYESNASSRREAQRQRDLSRNEAQREVTLLTTGRMSATISGGGLASGSNGANRNGSEKTASLTGQTLLRKLLQNDIRRERSLCLQLLRYIVDCNYLQKKRDGERKEKMDTTGNISESKSD